MRAGAITPPELSSGTFTVSNLGMFGIKRFVAVINPPQAAILAVGALEPRPVVRDGEVTVRSIMELTLSCDHRILYGADAAEFLAQHPRVPRAAARSRSRVAASRVRTARRHEVDARGSVEPAAVRSALLGAGRVDAARPRAAGRC